MPSKYISGKNQEEAIQSLLELILRKKELGLSLKDIMREAGEYYEADRSYIFEISKNGVHFSNTHEWCREGVISVIDGLQDLDIESFEAWRKLFYERNAFYLEKNEELKTKDPLMCELLEPQNVESLIVAPFMVDGTIKGFFGVDNPHAHKDHLLLMSILATSFYSEILHNKEAIENEYKAINDIHEVIGSGPWKMDFDENKHVKKCYWSDTLVKMLGHTDRSEFTDSIDTLINKLHLEDREKVLKAFWTLVGDLSGQKIYDIECRLMTKDEGYKWFRIAGKLLLDENGNPATMQGIFVDINETKKMSREISTALQNVEQANRAKSIFMNNMSHDIRTPMNAIIGFANLAATHIDDREVLEDYLSKIKLSGNQLLNILNDVMDMSRIESGSIALEEQEGYMPFLFSELLDMLQDLIKDRRDDITFNAENVKNENIYTDNIRLLQVLYNIISNALKYTPVGKKVSVRIIEVPCVSENRVAFQFRIKDQGCGMSKDYQRRIFEPFSREISSMSSGVQGAGLGMAIAKNILDLMEGQISIKSDMGIGTEVVVDLIFERAGRPYKYEPIRELHGVKALVLDENIDNCMSVSGLLRELGLRPVWTLSGKEAVKLAKEAKASKEPFGAYIIDWQTTDMKCFDIAKKIRKIADANVPIIVLGTNNWAEVEAEGTEAGVSDFIPKPVFLSELRGILSRPLKSGKIKTKAGKSFKGKRILLVEDNELNQEIEYEILTEAGFMVDALADGSQALERMKTAKAGAYDLILMDIQMPVMNGYDATRAIRALERPGVSDIPIIATTAQALDEDVKNALEAGMNGHIAKPINIEYLNTVLSDVLK